MASRRANDIKFLTECASPAEVRLLRQVRLFMKIRQHDDRLKEIFVNPQLGFYEGNPQYMPIDLYKKAERVFFREMVRRQWLYPTQIEAIKKEPRDILRNAVQCIKIRFTPYEMIRWLRYAVNAPTKIIADRCGVSERYLNKCLYMACPERREIFGKIKQVLQTMAREQEEE